MANKTAPEKPKTDWELVEVDYRVGVKSLRQMANEYGCSEGAIRKKAKLLKWVRDLSGKVKKRAEDLVRSEEVRAAVRIEKNVVATEAEKIEISAINQATKILEHRSHIEIVRNIMLKMYYELEHVTDNVDLFEQLGELLIDTTPNENGKVDQNQYKRREALNRALDLSSRVDSLKKLSEVLKTLIGLEREAFNIGTALPDSGGVTVREQSESWSITMTKIRKDIEKHLN